MWNEDKTVDHILISRDLDSIKDYKSHLRFKGGEKPQKVSPKSLQEENLNIVSDHAPVEGTISKIKVPTLDSKRESQIRGSIHPISKKAKSLKALSSTLGVGSIILLGLGIEKNLRLAKTPCSSNE